MNKKLRTAILTLAAVIMLTVCFAVTSYAAGTGVVGAISYSANDEDANTAIYPQEISGEYYLFLPSSADLENLTLTLSEGYTALTIAGNEADIEVKSGESFNLLSLFSGERDEYALTLTANGAQGKLILMKSANLRSMFLVSENADEYGRLWVDSSKSNKGSGSISIVSATGDVDFTNELTEIKGRGNSTFTRYEKKPYQIKLAKKADLIGGTAEEANKKWVLLADAADSTLIRNQATFALATAIGMEYTPIYEAIDLYYDGEYRGTYTLTEKTEVGSSRIDIEDLDELIEEANAKNNAYKAAVSVYRTVASDGEESCISTTYGSYKFIHNITEPTLAEGMTHHAYLLELDYTSRYQEEPAGFITERGQAVVTKNPEYLTQETGLFISKFWQEFEDAVYSPNGYNAETGKYYYEYCDLDSLVNLYLINELSKNCDSFRSSTYFYLPEDEDIMYAGPVWDYDRGFGPGSFSGDDDWVYNNPENFFAVTQYLADALITIESFRNEVKAQLNSDTGEFYLAAKALCGENGTVMQLMNEKSASQKMNNKLWNECFLAESLVESGDRNTYENNVEFLESFIAERLDWLSDEVSQWNGSDYRLVTDATNSLAGRLQSFFARIANFFRSIFEWLSNLFGG